MWGQPCGGSIPLARTIEDNPYSIRFFSFYEAKNSTGGNTLRNLDCEGTGGLR